MTVVQIMGANLLSNRFFTVHPRRNDRFLKASTVLQAIYPEIDFSDYSFTRHMLGALHATSLDRFETVVRELREAWLARMGKLLDQVGEKTMLFWFAEDPPSNRHWSENSAMLRHDPLFITADMLQELRPRVKEIVVVTPSKEAVKRGTSGMIYPVSQQAAAQEMLGVDCHTEAAATLLPKLRDQLFRL